MNVTPEPGEVHLWTAATNVAPERLARCRALLGPDEHRRAERYRWPRHAAGYVVAHALLRAALSLYAPIAPGAWAFTRTGAGRPEPVPSIGLRFSLSRTDGLAVVAIARGCRVGADVEHLAGAHDEQAIARTALTPSERASLPASQAAERRARLLDHWTLKEAYIKATGTGLSRRVDQIGFRVTPGSTVVLENDDPGGWRFALLDATPDHRVAIALRSDRQLAVRLDALAL